MNLAKTKNGIVYYRLLKDEIAPEGFFQFTVLMKNRGNNFQMQPHFIAARSDGDAEKIVVEDYQTEGRGYLRTKKGKRSK